MKAAIIIPARMASTRYPNKPMAQIAGKAMIERVWNIALSVESVSDVFVATDDQRLYDFATGFGAKALMTSSQCVTGTDRVAEAALMLDGQYEVVFNLQGDAVLTPPWIVEEVVSAMLADSSIQMATPAVKLTGQALADFVASKQAGSTSGTTVVFDKNHNALYFSKTLLPHARDGGVEERLVYHHIGLYGYRQETLQALSRLPESPLEKWEKLEQLRALENGIPIRVVLVDYQGRTHGSVDRPEDVAFVESVIAREGEFGCFV
jgi:3-deoxy-manno-octulosonate cytidylyltransferase (CMP-KDO synthetase)